MLFSHAAAVHGVEITRKMPGSIVFEHQRTATVSRHVKAGEAVSYPG